MNFGKPFEYYIVPVAAILLILLFPNIRRLGTGGVELAPLSPKAEGPMMQPMAGRGILEKPRPSP